MSPKKKEPLTRATDVSPEDLAAAVPQPVPELPASVIVEVPLGPLDHGYLSRHVDARLTTDVQCKSLRRLVKGLRQAGEKLQDGKPVASYADAVKWLLERIGQE